jgi:sulfonate transport system permease protein
MSRQTDLIIRPAVPPKTKTVKLKLHSRWPALARDTAIGAILPVLALVLWQWAADRGHLNPMFLPAPAAILESFRALLATGELAQHLGISAQRAALGFLLGGGLGFLFGLAAGLSRKAEHTLDPSIQMLRMIPHLAFAPLVILWFGFGEVSKILIIAQGAFFPLYVNTFMGIRNVDNKLFEVSRVLRFSRRKRIFRLVLPAALPSILLGLRLSLALAWIGLVVAELIGSTSGIGFLLNVGKHTSDTALIFVGVLVFAAAGKLVDSLVRLLERKWLHWRDSYEG